MKQIPLTQGQFTIVDDTDYDWLSQYKWYAHKEGRSFYAVRGYLQENGKRSIIRMSRQILGLEQDDSQQSDHINHNTLDNRQDNLRMCTSQQNLRNRKSDLNTTSRFKGVGWDKQNKKWRGDIKTDVGRKNLGRFNSEIFAALVYDQAAKKYFGEFAHLNFN